MLNGYDYHEYSFILHTEIFYFKLPIIRPKIKPKIANTIPA